MLGLQKIINTAESIRGCPACLHCGHSPLSCTPSAVMKRNIYSRFPLPFPHDERRMVPEIAFSMMIKFFPYFHGLSCARMVNLIVAVHRKRTVETLDVVDILLLSVLIFLGAMLYSSVGHGGASAYLAVMALFGIAPAEMKPTALLLNILVSVIFLVYIRRETYDVCENGEISCGRHRLVFWTAAFFYRHLSLVALSLIPSVLRAIQMWNELHTPFWMEIAVALSRVFLFALILAKMADTNLGAVFRKVFWDSWNNSLTAQIKKTGRTP